jgi:hypothetical protein
MKRINYAYLWIHLIRSERKDSHISHFALTTELLGLLQKAASLPESDACIATVSSTAHATAKQADFSSQTALQLTQGPKAGVINVNGLFTAICSVCIHEAP